MGKEEKKTEVISEFSGKGFEGGKGKCVCGVGGGCWGKKAQNNEEEIKLPRNIKIFKKKNKFKTDTQKPQREYSLNSD